FFFFFYKKNCDSVISKEPVLSPMVAQRWRKVQKMQTSSNSATSLPSESEEDSSKHDPSTTPTLGSNHSSNSSNNTMKMERPKDIDVKKYHYKVSGSSAISSPSRHRNSTGSTPIEEHNMVEADFAGVGNLRKTNKRQESEKVLSKETKKNTGGGKRDEYDSGKRLASPSRESTNSANSNTNATATTDNSKSVNQVPKLTFTYPKTQGHVFMIDGKKGNISFEYDLNNPDLFARRASIDIVHVTGYDQESTGGGTPKNERLLRGIPLNNVYQCHVNIHVDKFMRLDKKTYN
ncbi:hypothetical protein RFI_09991, partial [Reticulomyxa filosa]